MRPAAPKSSQDLYYLAREADAFYARNLAGSDPLQLRPAKREIADWIASAEVRPRRVLEYGCSHGDLLYHYASAAGAEEAHGVEPSGLAIERGRKSFGDRVQLHPGTLADNPLCSDPAYRGRFDLVIVEDVLCWVGRETLFDSIAHIDDALADGGFLFVREFLPRVNTRNRNHHVGDADVYCHKLASTHASMFTAAGIYGVVAQRVWVDRADDWVADAGRDPYESRWCDTLLRKSYDDYWSPGG